MQRRKFLVIFVFAGLGIAIASSAYVYLGFRWSPDYARYELNIAGWQSFPIHNAKNTWNAGGSAFLFNYLGDNPYPLNKDGHNTITRANRGNNGVLGNTAIWCTGGTCSGTNLIEVDTEFNHYYPWGAYGEPNMYDLESAMVHEFGHWLVLGHSSSSCGLPWAASMCDGMGVGQTWRRSIENDDKNGIRSIYP